MTRPSWCAGTAGRSLTRGRPVRPAAQPRRGALRRTLAGALTAAAVGVGVVTGGTVTPVLAGWTASTTATAGPLTMATVSSTFTKAATSAGTLSADGSTYAYANSTTAGYLDLVNTSTVPATSSLTITLVGVVGIAPVSFCTVPWTSGNCTPGATTISAAALLSTQSKTYTTTQIAARASLYFKVTPGLGVSVTLTRTAVTPRAAGDRTTS